MSLRPAIVSLLPGWVLASSRSAQPRDRRPPDGVTENVIVGRPIELGIGDETVRELEDRLDPQDTGVATDKSCRNIDAARTLSKRHFDIDVVEIA